MDTLYLFIINIFLVGFLFFKEYQHKKEIRDILSARLSRDVYEFKEGVEEEKEEIPEPSPEEIPLEKVEVDELFKNKNSYDKQY